MIRPNLFPAAFEFNCGDVQERFRIPRARQSGAGHDRHKKKTRHPSWVDPHSE
jgi:hypothetical protein